MRILLFSYYISTWHARDTYVLRHPPGLLPLMAVRCSEREVIITFEIWIFSLQKRKDSLQGAFIHPPEVQGSRFKVSLFVT